MDAVAHHLVVPRTARYLTLGDTERPHDQVWFLLHGYGQLASTFLESARCLAAPSRLLVVPEALSRFYLDNHRSIQQGASTDGRRSTDEPSVVIHDRRSVGASWMTAHGERSTYQPGASTDGQRSTDEPSVVIHDRRSVGASWMTAHDREHEMDDYVRYLDLVQAQVFEIASRSEAKVGVLGFSQGVATATRWALRGSIAPDALVLWGDAMPPEVGSEQEVRELSSMDFVCVSGLRDPLFPEPKQLAHRERLGSLGVRFRALSFNGGHRLDNETLVELARTI